MKKTISMVAGFVLLLLSVTMNAQEPQTETKAPQSETKTWDAKKNPTVDSITAPYAAKMIPARPPLTTEQIFPVLGQYQSAENAEVPSVVITLDEQNKGIVWVDGLPQGRIKAMLRKSPATYKIPAQKNADGKDVAEGTLYFDQEANTLHIVIGKPYNAEDPALVFAAPTEEPVEAEVKVKNGKKKVKKVAQPKAWVYTATKVEKTTAMTE
jgi:hypothetical protein